MKKASSPSGAIGLIDPALARLDQGQELERTGREKGDRISPSSAHVASLVCLFQEGWP
jgi:hypothetical protein